MDSYDREILRLIDQKSRGQAPEADNFHWTPEEYAASDRILRESREAA